MDRHDDSHSMVLAEFMRSELGDERRTDRLVDMARRKLEHPDTSFPKAMGDRAALEAGYRLLNNPGIDPGAMLQPHFVGTQERAQACGKVLAIHDTTIIELGGNGARPGFGRLRGKTSAQGVLAHSGLVVAAEKTHEPLGLIQLKVWTRLGKKKSRPKESKRWWEGVAQAANRLEGVEQVIHVMDRESDDYSLLSAMVAGGHPFVIRACSDRPLGADGSGGYLMSEAGQAPLILEREVVLSKRRAEKRPPIERRIHPSRRSHLARLAIRATTVELKRSKWASWKTTPPALKVQVVRVDEIDAPVGEPPVSWTLITSLPIQTAEEVAYIVDAYRARWIIEEFFKALKTGCRVEGYQLESFAGLLRALAIDVPIAWHLLRLRTLARHRPEAPATTVFNSVQLKVLQTFRKAPPAPLTVKQAFDLVAQRGGHIKQNGEPGWLVLHRGYRDLLLLEMGWRAATEKCDQS